MVNKKTDEEMFLAIVNAVDSGKITIEALPGSDELKAEVKTFIETRDKELNLGGKTNE